MEWVEAIGPTVDAAVTAALADLGVDSVEDVEVEVLQEASPGFLGMGARQAMVKVTQKPRRRNARRRTRKSSGKQEQRGEQQQRGGQGDKPRQQNTRKRSKDGPAKQDGERRTMDTSDNGKGERPEPAPIEDQAAVATAFLDGLLEAFGLEGSVESRIEDEVLYLDVHGEQTEALVGPKGATMYSVLELTRTTVQRKTYGAPRMRIDIAGYGARRREALAIYTRKLADQVLADGGEIMLEPMNAADRKVVHDAAAEIEGIHTHSEGDDPRRAVVISLVEE
jgi:spoIIIJ-associated protein